MAGPFQDLRVIEFGRFIAAPYCGQLLADGGADVVKVEPLHGDDARRNGTRLSPTEARQYLNKNRGKRSIAVKLSDAGVRRALSVLLERADVVIANFRPGQAAELGLDYETLAKRNPRLVYAENTGFGKRGPSRDLPGMDTVLQAYTGFAPLSGGIPQPLADPVIDYTAALLMAWGIAAALYDRERRGVGQRLDVSLLQAALVIQNNSINHIDAVDGWREEFAEYLKDAFREGRSFRDVMAHRETLKPVIAPPYYGIFEVQDGLLALAANVQDQRAVRADVHRFRFDRVFVRVHVFHADPARCVLVAAQHVLGSSEFRGAIEIGHRHVAVQVVEDLVRLVREAV